MNTLATNNARAAARRAKRHAAEIRDEVTGTSTDFDAMDSGHPYLPYVLQIGERETVPVRDLADASCEYQLRRDMSGEGGSTFPEGVVLFNGENVARISYNGRVWRPGPWREGDVPLMEAQ